MFCYLFTAVFPFLNVYRDYPFTNAFVKVYNALGQVWQSVTKDYLGVLQRPYISKRSKTDRPLYTESDNCQKSIEALHIKCLKNWKDL